MCVPGRRIKGSVTIASSSEKCFKNRPQKMEGEYESCPINCLGIGLLNSSVIGIWMKMKRKGES